MARGLITAPIYPPYIPPVYSGRIYPPSIRPLLALRITMSSYIPKTPVGSAPLSLAAPHSTPFHKASPQALRLKQTPGNPAGWSGDLRAAEGAKGDPREAEGAEGGPSR